MEVNASSASARADVTHVMYVESALASLESALRRGIAPDSLAEFHPLESVADLYLERPTGHRLDNIDRALASYMLASKTAACALQPSADLNRARLSAKVAKCWYLRLQYVSEHCPDMPLVKRAHLRAAADAIDIAIQRYDDCQDWQHDQHQCMLYKHALLCKGFIYHAMCTNIDLHMFCDVQNDDADLQEKQTLWRHMYVNSCIQSLEKALLSDTFKRQPNSSHSSPSQTRPASDNKPQVNSNPSVQNPSPQHDLHDVTKARAIICLARAYVDASNTASEKVSKALSMLTGVQQMLETVDVNKYHDGFVVTEDDLQHMKEDAKCLEKLLKQSRPAASEGGCVIS